MIHPYPPSSLKGRILRALKDGPVSTSMLYFLSSSTHPGAFSSALDELAREGYVRRDPETWRLASQPPVAS